MFTVTLFSLYRFFYHALIVGDRDKMSKNYSRVQAKFALQPSFAKKTCGRAQPQLLKKMAENFILFAIDEKIAVQMPENIARRAKIQLDE